MPLVNGIWIPDDIYNVPALPSPGLTPVTEPVESYIDPVTGITVFLPVSQVIKQLEYHKEYKKSDIILEKYKDNPLVLESLSKEITKSEYVFRMLSGNKKYLSQKMNKVEGQKALNQIMKKSSKYSAIATMIPGFGTAAGFLVGNMVGITEIFISNANKKTAKDILTDFIVSLFEKDSIKREKNGNIYMYTTLDYVIYKEDINSIIDLIKESFTGSILEKAANSLYLSEEREYFSSKILNIVKFKVNKISKPIEKMNVKKLALIGAGLLILRFLIFKG